MPASKLGQYAWLLNEPAPRMLIEALKLYGVKEIIGDRHNQTILDWADEIGVGNLYEADEIPWCGLFVGVVAKRAGKPVVNNPLWARNWAKWGVPCMAKLGCVLVFSRETGGHVGLYVGEDDKCFHVLGGNQGNSVSIVRIEKSRMISSRHLYSVGAPANVRKVWITSEGGVSRNEA